MVANSGSASADRRPVDPPPVVELRIFEGNSWQEAEHKDITFLYNANFFLYATLEHARVIAHGRVQTPAANQPPVLTGMPVSGMAYLDRPNEAGYFLFPDLSVRHEGRYRLTFNLYEETKEDKDKDPDTPDSNIIAPGFSNATGGSFDFRMEVKSKDFIVYSAKKFPGLAESTQLSRVVAEQGCRVRIRRDVRMRRRDRAKDEEEGDNQDEYSAQKRTGTPDGKPDYRARSMSGSVERTSFSGESQRRPSGAEYPPQYPLTPVSAGGHLQFLGNGAQYHPHAQPHSKPPSVPPSPSYQTSHGAHFPPPPVHQSPHQHLHQQSAPAQSPVHQAPQQPMHQPAYPPPQQQQQQPYVQAERPQFVHYTQNHAQSHASPQRETAPRDFREPAPPQYREPAPREFRESPAAPQTYQKEFMLPPMAHKPAYHPPPPAPHQPARTTIPSLTLPPISDFTKQLPAPPRMGSLTSPTTDRVPPLHSMPPPKLAAPLPPPPSPSVAGSKRSRDDSRRYDIETPRYHNGAREDPQMLDDMGEPQLIYRRANGAEVLVPHDEEPRP